MVSYSYRLHITHTIPKACSTLVIRAKPAVFHFSLADSIYQQNLAKNGICNLSLIITGLQRRKVGDYLETGAQI